MLVKAVVFGCSIAVVACGWPHHRRPEGGGTSTTGAVGWMILVTVSLMDVACSTKLLFERLERPVAQHGGH